MMRFMTIGDISLIAVNHPRHVDSAQAYRNETAVGEAVRDSGIDRGEFFISACHEAVQEMSFHPLPNVSDEMYQQKSWI